MVSSVLDGNAGKLIQELNIEMDIHSKNLEYEKAAEIRDIISSIQSTVSQQIINSRFYQDCDAIGLSLIHI